MIQRSFFALVLVGTWAFTPQLARGGIITVTYKVTMGSVTGPALTLGTFMLTTQGTGPHAKSTGPAALNTLHAFGPNASVNLITSLPGTANVASAFTNQVPALFVGTWYGVAGYGNAAAGALTIANAGGFTATLKATGFGFQAAGGPTNFNGTLTVVGQEVSRTFLPEPRANRMLGLGLLGLTLIAIASVPRKRRRSGPTR